jgi:hypothetical protein
MYSPGNKITRGDFVLMLVWAFNPDSTGATSNFPDVEKNSYYYEAIAITKKLGSARKQRPVQSEGRPVQAGRDGACDEDAGKLRGSRSPRAATASDISSFTDRSSISSYASDSVEGLCWLKRASSRVLEENKSQRRNHVPRSWP